MSVLCKKCHSEMKRVHTTKTNVQMWVCEKGGWRCPWRTFWNGSYGKRSWGQGEGANG